MVSVRFDPNTSTTVIPTATTTYTGTFSGPGGSATCSATVVTVPALVVVPPTPPIITSISTSSADAGDIVTLHGKNFSSENTIILTPQAPTAFIGSNPFVAFLFHLFASVAYAATSNTVTLTAPSPDGSTISFAVPDGVVAGTYTITVQTKNGRSITKTIVLHPRPAPLCSLSVNPSTVVAGHTATLSWSAQYATTLSIATSTAFITTTAASGRMTVAPTATTTYLGTVTNAIGATATCSAILAVNAQATPDTIPPSVSLTVPANGATVSGTTNITATASDNVGVAGVQFQLDGKNIGAKDATAPYSISWNTALTTNGTHSLSAIATDAAGNTATSSESVTVSNNAAFSNGSCTNKCIGMGYEVWYNQMYNFGTREAMPLLGRYSSTDPAAIDQHAQWFSEIGVDFLILDWSYSAPMSGKGNPGPDNTTRSNTDALFAEYEKLSQEGKPHPYITIMVGDPSDRTTYPGIQTAAQDEANYIYTNYVKKYPDIYYGLDGKPLLLTYIGAVDNGATDGGWRDSRFTDRVISGTLESSNSIWQNPTGNTWWSWYDRDPMAAYENGSVEAVTVTSAYPGAPKTCQSIIDCWTSTSPEPSWDPRPAAGRDQNVFATQWAKAVSFDPKIIVVNQWNEFSAPDQYSVNLSQDLEPTYAWGCGPITTLQQAVATWKQITLPPIRCLSGSQPTISILSPANGTTVQNPQVITATASSSLGIMAVQFQLDGTNLGAKRYHCAVLDQLEHRIINERHAFYKCSCI